MAWITIVLGGGALMIVFAIFRTELLRQAVLHYPYYFLGYIYGKNEIKLSKILDKLVPIAAVIYPFSMMLYSFKDRTIVVKRLQTAMKLMGLTDRLQEFVVAVAYHGGFQIYNYLIVAMFGSAFYFLIAKLIAKHCVILKQFLCMLGKNTLQIYVISSFCYITAFNKAENWVLSLISCTMVPLLCTKLIDKKTNLGKILFGV